MKKYYFSVTLGMVLSLLTNLNASTSNYLASQVYSDLERKVFQVKTALSKDAPKSSYGTGFVVAIDGKIITNYHVVSRSLEKYNTYQIYVDVEGEMFEAKILEIDIIHDLALLKIDKKLDNSLKIRMQNIKIGERIFSMGIPKDLGLSITEGIYNGIKKNGLYENIHMSNPLNAGMSGGPVIDSKGELVGVNVSILLKSQNISFAVTSKSVKRILDKYNSRGKDVVQYSNKNDKAVDSEIEKQLLNAQESLTTDFMNTAKKSKKEGLWSYTKPSKELTCWQVDNSDKDKNLYHEKKEICYVPSSSHVKHDLYGGTYELKYSIMSTDKLSLVKFYNYVNSVYNGEQMIESLYINFFANDNYTKYECDKDIVFNTKDIPFKINYCVKAYVNYKGIYDVDFKAVTLLKDKNALFLRLTLRGFTSNNINQFIQTLLNDIRFSNNVDYKNI